jgi:WD40 repeat protein
VVDLRNQAIAISTRFDLGPAARVEVPGMASARGDVVVDRPGRHAAWFDSPSCIKIVKLAGDKPATLSVDVEAVQFAMMPPCLQFDPRGELLASYGLNKGRGLLTVIDVGTGTVLWHATMEPDILPLFCVRTVDFSTDGSALVVAATNELRVHEPRTGEVRKTFPSKYRPCVRLDPAGRRVAYGGLNELGVIDVETGPAFEITTLNITCLAWTPDAQQIISGNNGGLLQIWNASDGKLVDELKGHRASVTDVAFSADGRYLSSRSNDNSLIVWDWISRTQLLRVAYADTTISTSGHSLWTRPEGEWLVRLDFPTSSAQRQWSSPKHDGTIDALAFSPDGTWLATAEILSGVRIWAVSQSRPVSLLYRPYVKTIQFDESGIVACDSTAFRWAIRGHDAQRPVFGPLQALGSEKGTHAALCNRAVRAQLDAKKVILLPMDSDQPFAELPHAAVDNVSVDGQKRFATSVSLKGEMRIWQLPEGTILHKVVVPERTKASISPAGDFIVGSTPRGHVVWRRSDAKVALDVRCEGAVVDPPPAVFSADGRLLALAIGQSGIKLIDTQAVREYATLRSPPYRACSIAFSDDGKHLAAGLEKGEISLWDLSRVADDLERLGLLGAGEPSRKRRTLQRP